MAAPQLAIAKAALSASLFRADPISLSRPSVEDFFNLLDTATTQCSRPNVQKCRAWIVEHVTPSNARATALGKYLNAFSKSLDNQEASKPSAKRKRLHILYILNDTLHHTVIKQEDKKLEQALQSFIPSLVANAASYRGCPKHARKVEDLVALWEEKAYVSPTLVARLRDALTGGVSGSEDQEPQTALGATSLKIAKDAPFVLPSHHGDTSTPWFDLPASTWLPHLTPNSTKPMLPDLIKPIQLSSGPANKSLTEAVQELLSDVERIFGKGKIHDFGGNDVQQTDTNQLGEMVLLDEVTGNVIGGETYYGWSRRFCEKMKERRRKQKLGNGSGQRSRSRSRSYDSRDRSRSSSGPALKRRRRSSSVSSHENRHRGYRQSSRSPRGDSRIQFTAHRSRSSSRSRSRSRSYEDRRGSPDQGYTSQDLRPQPLPQQSHGYSFGLPPQPHNFPPVPPPGHFPPPPPPPPPPAGYQGSWSPPFPPPPVAGHPMPNWLPGPGFIPPGVGGWSAPSLPPPPPPNQQGWGAHSQRGRGPRGNGYYSRGDYGRGRGGR